MANRTRVVAARAVHWGRARETLFLEHLALSSNVAASERVALVPPGAAYRRRRLSPEFAANWDRALKDRYDRLELAMLERAINGVTVTITDARGKTTSRIEYSEGMAMTLLKAHRAHVAAITAAQAAQAAEADILDVIDGMARRAGHADPDDGDGEGDGDGDVESEGEVRDDDGA